MKKRIRYTCIYLVVILCVWSTSDLKSQPDPPQLPEQHGLTGNQNSSGVPLADGYLTMILLGLIYGGQQWLANRKRSTSE